MLKALIRTRLQALGSGLMRSSSKKRTGRLLVAVLSLLLLYSAGCFVLLFYLMDSSLCGPLHEAGIGWLYWGMSAFFAAGLGCFLTMLLAEHQLFLARDNEMLLSLPVPPRDILFSRMCMLLLMAYLTAALILAPAAVVYQQQIGFTAGQAILLAVLALTLPLLALALACLAGWGLAYISSRARHKSLASVLATAVLLGLYFAGMSMANRAMGYILQFGMQAAQRIAVWGAPLYWFGLGAGGSVPAALGTAALNIGVFILVYIWLSKSFYRIVTMRRGAAKVKYTEKTTERRTVQAALLQNQLRHFGAAPGWMINGGIGALLGVGAGVALLIRRDAITVLFGQMPGTPPAGLMLALVAGFCIGMCIISSACISLEAKTLWILQSSPLSAGCVLRSMAALQLTITLPAGVLMTLLGSIGLGLSVGTTLAVLAAVVGFALLGAPLGVWCNLHFPKFDWMSETQAVKQGISSLICMLLSFLLLAALGGGYYVLNRLMPGASLDTGYLLAVGAGCTLGALGLFRWMEHKGAALFAAL